MQEEFWKYFPDFAQSFPQPKKASEEALIGNIFSAVITHARLSSLAKRESNLQNDFICEWLSSYYTRWMVFLPWVLSHSVEISSSHLLIVRMCIDWCCRDHLVAEQSLHINCINLVVYQIGCEWMAEDMSWYSLCYACTLCGSIKHTILKLWTDLISSRRY